MNKNRSLRLSLSRTTLRHLDAPSELAQVHGGRINNTGGPRPNASCAVYDCGSSPVETSGGNGSIVLCP